MTDRDRLAALAPTGFCQWLVNGQPCGRRLRSSRRLVCWVHRTDARDARIRADAADAERARIAAGVRGLAGQNDRRDWPSDLIPRAAVLRIIAEATDDLASPAVPEGPWAIVDEQAEDEGLWFIARTAPEAYLQQELRRLHAAVEAACPAAPEWLTPDHRPLLEADFEKAWQKGYERGQKAERARYAELSIALEHIRIGGCPADRKIARAALDKPEPEPRCATCGLPDRGHDDSHGFDGDGEPS